jgi:4-diphosphocytidyl-2-C-methyl-D-erythritol kinase
MIVFPNAKINIGLSVTNKRSDGFHELESVFYPIKWSDVLEVQEASNLSFRSTGIGIPGKNSDNLCLKAYEIIKNIYDIPLVNIHLHKNIPIGAGMGGGSSDGAFMLRALNDLFCLNISIDEQMEIAGNLGSDCPFFILNRPCLVKGTGDILKPLELNLGGYKVLLINPSIHINTAWAYGHILPCKVENNWFEVLTSPIKEWKGIKNDFESIVFEKEPSIAKIKHDLYDQGALYSSMSGSGSTVFAIFEKDQKIDISPFSDFQIFIHEA